MGRDGQRPRSSPDTTPFLTPNLPRDTRSRAGPGPPHPQDAPCHQCPSTADQQGGWDHRPYLLSPKFAHQVRPGLLPALEKPRQGGGDCVWPRQLRDPCSVRRVQAAGRWPAMSTESTWDPAERGPPRQQQQRALPRCPGSLRVVGGWGLQEDTTAPRDLQEAGSTRPLWVSRVSRGPLQSGQQQCGRSWSPVSGGRVRGGPHRVSLRPGEQPQPSPT